MTKKAKILCLVIAVVLALTIQLCGCTQTKNISLFIYDKTDTFIGEMSQTILSELPKSFNVHTFYASNTQSLQNYQIVERLNKADSLLLVNVVDRVSSGTIISKCEEADVPVIFFNREPLESDLAQAKNAFYVGAAPEDTGIKQAGMVIDFLSKEQNFAKYDANGDGQIQTLILKGQQGHQDAEKRTSSCVNELKKSLVKFDFVATEIANWSRTEAYELYKKSYSEAGIELILSNNDDMALGAIDYLTEAGLFAVNDKEEYSQPILVVGVDGTKAGKDAIAKGLMYGTVLNDEKKQSEVIVQLTDFLVNGKDLAQFPYPFSNKKYIYVEGEIILKSNVK